MTTINGRKCHQCTKGLSPGCTKSFSAWCPGCQQKKLDGLRTGLEPPPAQWRPGGFQGRRLGPEAFARTTTRQRANEDARRAQMQQLPITRKWREDGEAG